ncbi:MAG: hypothetical protein IRD3MM_00430 [Candidatus Midichloria mitochondrii]
MDSVHNIDIILSFYTSLHVYVLYYISLNQQKHYKIVHWEGAMFLI